MKQENRNQLKLIKAIDKLVKKFFYLFANNYLNSIATRISRNQEECYKDAYEQTFINKLDSVAKKYGFKRVNETDVYFTCAFGGELEIFTLLAPVSCSDISDDFKYRYEFGFRDVYYITAGRLKANDYAKALRKKSKSRANSAITKSFSTPVAEHNCACAAVCKDIDDDDDYDLF